MPHPIWPLSLLPPPPVPHPNRLQLMYWLMITGYTLRQLEQRCDLTRTLDLPPPGPDPPSLPPGRLR